MTINEADKRCGFVAVIGAPNAGKSTLINTMVGGKVTIVSPKVQTTRTTVRGIAMHEEAQIIFVDTPGLFQPQKRMERAMVAAAWSGHEEADIVLLVCDASNKKAIRDTENIIKILSQNNDKRRTALVLNKVDGMKPPELLPLTVSLNKLYDFDATFMVSAEKARGTKDILSYVAKHLPVSTWHYPEDQMGDMPMRMLASEITREKLFHKLYLELPQALTVETEKWEERPDGSAMVHQAIIVARDSHKPIVLGKGGSLIKSVGEESRKELEEITGHRLHLKLFVKVEENWAEDPQHYTSWGLEFDSKK